MNSAGIEYPKKQIRLFFLHLSRVMRGMLLRMLLFVFLICRVDSHAAESGAPVGAIVLSDGEDLNLFKSFDRDKDLGETSVYGGPGYRQPTWRLDNRTIASHFSKDLITRHQFSNYELHLEYQADQPGAGVYLSGRYLLGLDETADGKWHALDLSFTHVKGANPRLSAWVDGRKVQDDRELVATSIGGFLDVIAGNPEDNRDSYRTGVARHMLDARQSQEIDLNGDFMIYARFKTRHALGGTLVSKSPAEGNWAPAAKALFIRGGRVHYDIGWVGVMPARKMVADGQWHAVLLVKRKRSTEIYVDGMLEATRRDFERADNSEHRIKFGAASRNFAFDFRGLIADVRVFDRSLGKKDAEAFCRSGDVSNRTPVFRWRAKALPADDSRPDLDFKSIDGVDGPIRLTAGDSGAKFRNVWVRPLDTIAHAEVLSGMTEKNFENGKRIYEGLCVNCHGKDGITPSLPISRAFGKGELKFGTDPFSIYQTLTHGNGNMAAQTWMTEQERYDVIHFIRERFMKPMHPQYRPITKDYLASLPRKISADLNAGRTRMVRDFGPALSSQFERTAVSALTIAAGGNTSMAYDLHTMNLLSVWDGGFLNVDDTQHMKLRGEGVPRPDGKINEGLRHWAWGHGGSLDYPKDDLLPRGPLPQHWMNYHGRYVHGSQVVLSYSIDGREILESPQKQKGFPALVHALQISPGKALTLCLGHGAVAEDNFSGVSSLDAAVHKWSRSERSVRGNILAVGELANNQPSQFVAAAVIGDSKGMTWRVDSQLRLVLNIPASEKTTKVDILRYAGKGEPALQSFAGLARHRAGKTEANQLTSLVSGGPARWPEVLRTKGELGTESAAYTLDSLAIPESNPWNSWFRTAALDFFKDGRMVITTHGGDVWIVSGIDRDLGSLKWKRFAAGLYEPFGVRVVNEQIYVTCKDRLTRLHDYNNDGEADFYESFSADTDVSFFFHAFNFDLQTDKDGNFYYAKAGQYTDHALPGAIIKVSPDGKTREVYCTGFRTPNGMGMTPDGFPTVSDNQGSWMPASKVSMVRPGGFYGYVQTHARPGGWAPDGGRIDHKKVIPPKTFDQPIIWMPQDFDNSSGGQLWVDDERWGPLAGRLLHTSFGKGWMYYFLLQDLGDVAQSGIVKLPLDFQTGIHRARVNPKDGQVYAVGLNGWNGGGRRGLGEGGIQRVRFTGRDVKLVTDMKVRPRGIEFTFNFNPDEESATNLDSYDFTQWNYKWAASYGSAQWSVENPSKQGRDKVAIKSAKLINNGRGVFLEIPGIQPVNQVFAKFDLKTDGGQVFEEEMYLTINRVPKK